MKVTIEQIEMTYEFTEHLAYVGMEVSEINKVMSARSAMRPHHESYKAFSEDVRKAHKPNEADWRFLEEVEQKGLENATLEDKKRHDELAVPYLRAVKEALAPELAKEIDLEIEPISAASVAVLLANNRFTLTVLEKRLSFLMPK